jgi:hypothetical protein
MVFCILGAVVLLTVSIPVSAHHGTALSYDASKLVTFKEAVVTELRFNNPHVQVFFDAKDETGKVVNWTTEGESPRRYADTGWSMKRAVSMLPKGALITITLAPARNGAAAGQIFRILNDKGEQVLTARGRPEGIDRP